MTIPVYRPTIDIQLIKMVQRDDNGAAERFTDASRGVDLTPLLGEGGVVQTTKSLRGDPAGAFTISFTDQPDLETKDSLYARIEPMDYIEIRATRNPENYAGAPLPLIMRGFVSTVRRSETIDQNGIPNRAVVVAGHDFGKLWQIHSVWSETAALTDRGALTVFGLSEVIGIQPIPKPIGELITEFTEKVMNPKIAAMEEYTTEVVGQFVADVSVQEGICVPQQLSEIGDLTFWQLISALSDQPWNELFVRDEEDGAHVVFRPAPYKDPYGDADTFILPDAVDPGTVDLDADEIMQWDVSRTDARVANFFWTPPGTGSLDTNGLAVAGALVDGSALDFSHGNNRPELYGEKKMSVPTSLLPTDLVGLPSTRAAAQRAGASTEYVQWYRHRADQLQAMNRDNSVFEDGGAVVAGREDYVVGQYVRVNRGALVSEAYIVAVSHSFQPLNTWTTTLGLERGTGFLERLKLDDGPFYQELRRGPYSQ